MKFFEGETVGIGRLIQVLVEENLVDLRADGRLRVKDNFQLSVITCHQEDETVAEPAIFPDRI